MTLSTDKIIILMTMMINISKKKGDTKHSITQNGYQISHNSQISIHNRKKKIPLQILHK